VPSRTWTEIHCPVHRAGDRTIKTLNLSANNIGDAGALTLAAILKSNTTLEVLDLSSNVIDYDGITAIAEALTDNTSLKALHIRCRLFVVASCLA
jgi:Ran GTPase-activating protein (RanGAP) involved in mRNA processing and transport